MYSHGRFGCDIATSTWPALNDELLAEPLRHVKRDARDIFWRHIPGGESGRVEAAGAKALCERDAEPLGYNIIHSVTNPIPRFTSAIHVYGGDFFKRDRRSEWDPETVFEQPWDPERAVRRFEEANELSARIAS